MLRFESFRTTVSQGRGWLRASALVAVLGIALVAACSGPERTTVPMPQPQVSFDVSPTPSAVAPRPTQAAPGTATPVPGPTNLPPTATPIVPTASPSVQPGPTRAPIEIPATGARVTLPLHLLARVGAPGDIVTVELRWQDGTTLAHPFTVVEGEDHAGLLLDSLDWQMESQPPQPPSQSASLTIRGPTGAILGHQDLTVLSPVDPSTQEITLYWLAGDSLYSTRARIPRTQRIASATIEELLWGPPPRNLAGFTTALPTPRDVLAFPGRQPDWGPRVTLRNLTIDKGIATVNFSKEMRAYGGGAARIPILRQQITRTLTQFSTIKDVRIAIEGQTTGVLGP